MICHRKAVVATEGFALLTTSHRQLFLYWIRTRRTLHDWMPLSQVGLRVITVAGRPAARHTFVIWLRQPHVPLPYFRQP